MTIWPGRTVANSLWLAAALWGADASAAVVAASDVVRDDTFLWGTNGPDKWGQVGLTSGGLVKVTSDFPNQSNGSMRLDLPNTNSKAGLAYYPSATFGKLSELTAVSFEWLVHSTRTADQAPVLRLYLRTAAGVHTQTLVYTPDIAGVHGVDLNTWTPTNVMTGIVWQGRSLSQGGIDPNIPRPFAAFQADPRFSDLVVFAVEGGAGNGSSDFVGAIDNIQVVGPLASVSANFEIVPPSASISCDKATLTDSPGQISTCTVSLSRPAEADTTIQLTTTGDATRYSGCTGPLSIAAAATTATCVVTATANTVKGDASATVSITIAPPGNVLDYTPLTGQSNALVQIDNDDGDVVVPVAPTIAPVPTLSEWALILLFMGLAGFAAMRLRRTRVN